MTDETVDNALDLALDEGPLAAGSSLTPVKEIIRNITAENPPAPSTDVTTVRLVTILLGVIVLAGMAAMAVLINFAMPNLVDGNVDQAGALLAVLALISGPTTTALGGLVMLLGSSRSVR